MYTAMVQYANKVRKCQAFGKTWRCGRWVELLLSQAEFPKLLNVKELISPSLRHYLQSSALLMGTQTAAYLG